MSNTKESDHYEGSPWFWKIFGSAIMGIISILLLAHITNINSNIDRSFLSLRVETKDLFSTVDAQKERLVGLEQNREQTKEKFATIDKNSSLLQSSFEEIKQKAAANEAVLAALKEEIKAMKEIQLETTRQLQDVREKLAAADGAKKANETQTKK